MYGIVDWKFVILFVIDIVFAEAFVPDITFTLSIIRELVFCCPLAGFWVVTGCWFCCCCCCFCSCWFSSCWFNWVICCSLSVNKNSWLLFSYSVFLLISLDCNFSLFIVILSTIIDGSVPKRFFYLGMFSYVPWSTLLFNWES